MAVPMLSSVAACALFNRALSSGSSTLVRARWPLPMVALTARADPEAEPAAFAAGMAAFVRKPVDGATLAATMERVLGGV